MRLSLKHLNTVLVATAVLASLGACRGEPKEGADSGSVSVDSGALSPVPPGTLPPALADTGRKADSVRPVDSANARERAATSPAGATTALAPSAPPAGPVATNSSATPPASTQTSTAAPTPAKIADAASPVHLRDSVPPPLVAASPTPFVKPAPAIRYHFARGEKFDYQVKFGPVSVGNATMEVLGIDTLRGMPAYHALFSVRGGVTFYKVNDRYESWFHPQSFASLRFLQDIDEGSYEAKRTYEIFPERQTFSENGKPEQPSVADPLDEASLIYLLRAMPLEVGKTYDLNRYFRPDRNPVRVTVVRKERVTVPAGTFDCIVVRPSIKAKGIFSEGGHAEVWFTDDSVRTMVQMKSKLSFGSLNLFLRSVRSGTAH